METATVDVAYMKRGGEIAKWTVWALVSVGPLAMYRAFTLSADNILAVGKGYCICHRPSGLMIHMKPIPSRVKATRALKTLASAVDWTQVDSTGKASKAFLTALYEALAVCGVT